MDDKKISTFFKLTFVVFFVVTLAVAGYAVAYTGPGALTAGSGAGAISVSGSNVGIGTTAPYSKLQVEGASAATAISAVTSPTFTLRNTDATVGAINPILFANSAGYGSASIYVPQNHSTNAGDNLVLLTKTSAGSWNLNQLVLDTAGRVGIGTSTPAYALDVNGTVRATSFMGSVSSGVIAADNVSSGSFGSLQGGGTYSFPSSLGVGTTTPAARFHVEGTQGTSQILITDTNAHGVSSQNASLIFSSLSTNSLDIRTGYVSTGNKITLSPGATTAMTLLGSGNVGIGTTTPTTRLDIVSAAVNFDGITVRGPGSGSGNVALNIVTGTNTWRIASPETASGDTGKLITFNGSTARMTIDASGNIGIGTTTPSYKLDVVGDINFSGTLRQNGTPFSSGGQWNTSSTSIYNTNAGNVGVGTASPQTLLNVGTGGILQVGMNTDSLYSKLGSNDLIFSRASNPSYVAQAGIGGSLAFDVSNVTSRDIRAMTILSNGNVGVGNAVPAYDLDVTGTGNFTGTVNVGTPTAGTNAATKSYVDTAVSSGVTGGISGTTNYVSKFTGANTVGNSLIYDTGTNVGIGTAAPNNPLQVIGAPTTGATTVQIKAQSTGTNNSRIGIGADNTNVYIMTGGSLANPPIMFTTNDNTTALMTILPTGRVGVGTTAPAVSLDVAGAIRTSRLGRFGTYNSTEVQGIWSIDSGYTISVASDTFGNQYGMGYAYSTNGGAPFSGQHQIVFTNNGTINAAIGLSGSGYFAGSVGVGTSAPAYKLDVSGTGNFTGTVNVGTPTAAGNAATKAYVDTAVSSGVTGGISGTTNYIPQFTGANSIGNSIIFATGTNIGIGTTNPGTSLEVVNPANGVQSVVTVGTNAYTGNSSALRLKSTSGYTNWQVASQWNVSNALEFTPSTAVNGTTFSTPVMTLLAGGNVGISTTTPTQDLVVGGARPFYVDSATGAIRVRGDASGWAFGYGALGNAGTNKGEFGFYGGADALTRYYIGTYNTDEKISIIASNGNVGIGTTTPAYKLDVQGTGNFTGTVNVGTPTAAGNAATKAYVDTAVSSGVTGGISGTTNYISKFTGANTVGNSLLFDTGTNVGIGTITPTSKLEVAGTFGTTGRSDWFMSNAATSTGLRWVFRTSSSAETGSNVGSDLEFISRGDTGAFLRSNLLLQRSTGNIGIGNTTPLQKLDLLGDNNVIRISDSKSFGAGGWVNQQMGGMEFYTVDPSGIGAHVGASIRAFSVGDPVDTTPDYALTFSTGAYNTTETERLRIDSIGNVGIGTTTPAYKLDVQGTGNFSQPILVGTPTAAGMAATKAYVDTAVAGGGTGGVFSSLNVSGSWTLSGAASSSLNMNGYNITGLNKLTVTTIDPVYTIDGVRYASYGPESIGISVLSDGKGILKKTAMANDYSFAIDFGSAQKGSDLWLFWQTISEGQGMKNITLSLTPEGGFAEMWYDLAPQKKQIIVHGNHPVSFSYHLSAPRFDSNKWGNVLTGTGEAGTTLREK